MIHPTKEHTLSRRLRFVAYAEKTGNPERDNRARSSNTKLTKVVNESLTFDVRGWKRKRRVRRIESENFAVLIVSVAEELATRARDESNAEV